MDFFRIGDKLISQVKIRRILERALSLRAQGYSQKEVAEKLQLERTFISRLESLGRVRRGNRIALIGFPVANKEEVLDLAQEEGIDYSLIMDDHERWAFIEERDGVTLFNDLLKLIRSLQEYEVIIFMGSDMRVELVESLLDGEVIGMPLGSSPIKGDVRVDIEKLKSIIDQVKVRRNSIETSR